MKQICLEQRGFPGGADGIIKLPFSMDALARGVIAAGNNPNKKPGTFAAQSDINMRTAALLSAVKVTRNRLKPTPEFLEAGVTEKGYKSFFVGNALCAHAALQQLGIPWLVDFEKLASKHKGIIGFTGTPLLKADRQTTMEVFGSYIHTYKFREAVIDDVVLDLVYEARDIEQQLGSQDKIDQWFESKTKGLNEWQKAALREQWGTMQKVLSSRSRMERVVEDNMRLLIVVDKLLTGFDAPSCTYLYIDKSMQDHGLFQAICRTNRLDGDDKPFGYGIATKSAKPSPRSSNDGKNDSA